MDDTGNVVCVATATLDPCVVARETAGIPHIVDFAVSAGIARAFLDADGVRYEVLPSDTPSRLRASQREHGSSR